MSALPKLIPFPGRLPSDDGAAGAAREEHLAAALAQVRQRWGYGSIVRLDRADALAAAKPALRPKTERELPPWWPRPLGPGGAAGVLRPRLLEVVAEPGSGRLTLALAWLAAACPTLAAILDTPAPAVDLLIQNRGTHDGGSSKIQNHPVERFYPPAAITAGLDPRQFIVVRPPADDPRAPLDAAAILLRSEAFDAVLCPLPPRARVSTGFAGKLATFAARANTSLLLLTAPVYTADGYAAAHGGVLAAFAGYRVRLGTRRWLWEDGELAGMKLRATTERARSLSSLSASDSATLAAGLAGHIAGGITHELTFRLHPRTGFGRPGRSSGADHLSLTTSVRVQHAHDAHDAPQTQEAQTRELPLRRLAT